MTSPTRAAEVRRRTVERALHDGAQQMLLLLRLDLTRSALEPEALDRRLAHIMDEIERLSLGRPPRVLDLGDLGAAMAELAAGMTIPVAVDVPVGMLVDGVTAEAVTFTVSEALTNVLRHSDAGRCAISLRRRGDHLVVSVSDDGRGGAVLGAGSGLVGLEGRATALGGRLAVRSSGEGTSVELVVPIGGVAAGEQADNAAEATRLGQILSGRPLRHLQAARDLVAHRADQEAISQEVEAATRALREVAGGLRRPWANGAGP